MVLGRETLACVYSVSLTGTVVCNIESSAGDRGKLAKASGDYGTIVAHNREENITRVRLPSGSKKAICSDCRGTGAVRVCVCVCFDSTSSPPILPPTLAFCFSSLRPHDVDPSAEGVACPHLPVLVDHLPIVQAVDPIPYICLACRRRATR